MGDAGPLSPGDIRDEHETQQVTVLVTGFGPFKSFVTNPSWLVAVSLPEYLSPLPNKSPQHFGQSTVRSADDSRYKIKLIVHPLPIRVSYSTVAATVAPLLEEYDPDFVLHIGMAGGRDHYTLEALAHRDHYKIKDVDDRDGWLDGEHRWRKDGLPERLDVGWEENDVLQRWRKDPMILTDDKARVSISHDAGRFLCEFILFESLSRRHMQGGDRAGKVAFLHVPGGYMAEDLERGRRVAEAAIRSLIQSWHEGYRSTPPRRILPDAFEQRPIAYWPPH